jgi:hypothetical protein
VLGAEAFSLAPIAQDLRRQLAARVTMEGDIR